MQVCILIPTYKRNDSLLRLLAQCNKIISNHHGPINYSITVTDSDPGNPKRAAIEKLCTTYLINPGSGFDDNLFFFYKDHAPRHDYVLSISDDDLFTESMENPLTALDQAILNKKAVTIFNHRDFTHTADKTIVIGAEYYNRATLSLDRACLKKHLLANIPRHIGLLYSNSAIQTSIRVMPKFRGTRHLYAVPLTLAEPESISLSNASLFSFCNDAPSGGAWESEEKVFSGLIQYLGACKEILPRSEFETMRDGFFQKYFGKNAWLRQFLENRKHRLPDERDIYNLIDEKPPAKVALGSLIKSIRHIFG